MATLGRRPRVLFLILLIGPALVLQARSAQAQLPQIQPDERDFEGLTSLSLGSGARAFGMGGAFLARPDDATAASWNPAGLSYLRRPEVSLVGVRNSFDRGSVDQNIGLSDTDSLRGYTPDFAALTYPVTVGGISGAVQISYQRVFSFKGRRDIHRVNDPDTGSNFDLVSFGHGGFDVLAVGSGLQVTRSLRLGATLNAWIDGYRQSRLKIAPRRQQQQAIRYDISGTNANLGIIWSPLQGINLGLVGKTAFTGELVVSRDRRDTDPLDNSVVGELSENRRGVELHLPGAVGVGISWRLRSPLTVSADYTRSFWSAGEIRHFFLLPPPTPNQPETEIREFPRLSYPSLSDQPQSDTEQFRVGAEYVLLRRTVRWPVRGGFFTDRQFFTDGSNHVPQYTGFTVGSGIGIGPVILDVAYLRERGRYLDPNLRRVSTRFERVFVSLIYRHQ